jgi:hypothetical protein
VEFVRARGSVDGEGEANMTSRLALERVAERERCRLHSIVALTHSRSFQLSFTMLHLSSFFCPCTTHHYNRGNACKPGV